MSREIDPRNSSHDVRQIRSNEPSKETSRLAPSRGRGQMLVRSLAHLVSSSERETLSEIGRFRTVETADVMHHRYGGNEAQMRKDLRALQGLGLVQRRTVWTGGERKQITALALTRRGKELVEKSDSRNAEQRIYAKFVKPAEIAHDAAIYRMYHREADKIGQQGGQIRRVVLDYELKERVYSKLGKIDRQSKEEYARRQIEIAQENALKVVRDKILLPDLRIEYETRDGERAHVDLELATHHYRGSQMRDKAEAGFKIYASADSVSRLSAAWDDHRIAASIVAL